MINIQEYIPLAKYTTFRIGGPAKYFVEVKNEEELMEALQYAKDNNLEFFILGGGSNLLISDKGFDGLAIQMHNTSFMIHDTFLECGAGVPLAKAIRESISAGLIGLEWGAGIPGTIGGAVCGNAGAYNGDVGSIVDSVRVLDIENIFPAKKENQNAKIKMQNDPLRQSSYEASNEKLKILTSKECDFSYRDSLFKKNRNLIILSAVLKLQPGNKEEGEKKFKEIISGRISKHPKGFSAGSFFVNPVVKNEKLVLEFEKETGKKSKAGKVPAPWLIERAGLKGKTIGGAKVSEEHANYIVNTGSATAEDIVMLASIIKQQVRDKFGVDLQGEVRYVGF